jgi:hypothetical protein
MLLRTSGRPRNGCTAVRAHGSGAPGWSMQVLARVKYDLARIYLIAHQWSLLFIFHR